MLDVQRSAWEEGIAIGFLREVGSPEPPIDPFELAHAAGIEVRYGSPPRRDGDRIYVQAKVNVAEQHWQLAHELGHWLLERAGEPQSEHGADLIAVALLAPRDELRRILRLGFRPATIELLFPACRSDLLRQRIAMLRG